MLEKANTEWLQRNLPQWGKREKNDTMDSVGVKQFDTVSSRNRERMYWTERELKEQMQSELIQCTANKTEQEFMYGMYTCREIISHYLLYVRLIILQI